MENRFVTIKDVAADANVSTATVSRALNEPWRVTHETRERVKASAEKLGYKPNFRARLLARGDSGTICFLLANRPFIHSVHAQILQGAAKEADLLGIQVVYAACSYNPNTPPSEIQMPRILAARAIIDGVIIAGTNYPNIISAIEQLDLPYILFGTNLVNGDIGDVKNAVYVDDEMGGYQATLHLISLGHTCIRYIGDLKLPWYRRRYNGYVRAMNEAGLKPYPAIGSIADNEMEMGFNAVESLCNSDEEFTALFVGGDMGALGAMKALRGRNISIPSDVSIVGFNDEELAEVAEPPLTTIRVPKEETGMKCVELLNERIRKNICFDEPIILPVEAIIRDSTTRINKT